MAEIVQPCSTSEVTTITNTMLKKLTVIGPGLITGMMARKIGTAPRRPTQPM